MDSGGSASVPARFSHPTVVGQDFVGVAGRFAGPTAGFLGKRLGRQRARSRARNRWRSHPGNSRQLRSPPGLKQVQLVSRQICRLRKVGEIQALPPFLRPERGSSRFPSHPDHVPHRELENRGSQSPRAGEGFQVGPGRAGCLLPQGSAGFPVPCHANPLGLKILQFNECPMRFRRKNPPFLQRRTRTQICMFAEKKSWG